VRCRRSEGKPGQMSLVKLILEIPINEEWHRCEWKELLENWNGFLCGRLLENGVLNRRKCVCGSTSLALCLSLGKWRHPKVLMGPELSVCPYQLGALLIHSFNLWRHQGIKLRLLSSCSCVNRGWGKSCCQVGCEGHRDPVPFWDSRNLRRPMCPEMLQMATTPSLLVTSGFSG
jgi:hypothetical protein